MQTKEEFESCDLKGFVQNKPETAVEFNSLAKEAGATAADPCCDMATDYAKFHRVLSGWRGDLMKLAAIATGVTPVSEPHPKGTKDAKGQVIQVVTEKPAVYLPRVKAQLAKDGKDVGILQECATLISQGIDAEHPAPKWFTKAGIDAKGYTGYFYKDFIGVTEAGPKTPPKTYVELANTILAQGPEKLKISLAKMAQPRGTAPLPVVIGKNDKGEKIVTSPTAEDIAWEIQAFNKAQAAALVG